MERKYPYDPKVFHHQLRLRYLGRESSLRQSIVSIDSCTHNDILRSINQNVINAVDNISLDRVLHFWWED